jgi:hypothetical protein
MLLRAQYRQIVAEQLIAANTMASIRVYQSRAIPTGQEVLPAILLQTPSDQKVSRVRGAPQFTETFDMVIVARVQTATYQTAERDIELFVEQIELAILANTATVNPVQQFESVTTQIVVDGSAGKFLGEASMTFRVETFQAYDPVALTPLQQITIDADINQDGTTDLAVVIVTDGASTPLPP